jgi:hypothetical protein
MIRRAILLHMAEGPGFEPRFPVKPATISKKIDDLQQLLASLGKTRRPDRAGGLAR